MSREFRAAAKEFEIPTSRAQIAREMGHPSFLDFYLMVKASVNSVFCSTSCAFALPVAGLGLELRFTLSTGRSPAIRFNRVSTLNIAPMFAGSS